MNVWYHVDRIFWGIEFLIDLPKIYITFEENAVVHILRSDMSTEYKISVIVRMTKVTLFYEMMTKPTLAYEKLE